MGLLAPNDEAGIPQKEESEGEFGVESIFLLRRTAAMACADT